MVPVLVFFAQRKMAKTCLARVVDTYVRVDYVVINFRVLEEN